MAKYFSKWLKNKLKGVQHHVIREMLQIIMWYHFVHSKMVIIETVNTTCQLGWGETEFFLLCWWECKMKQNFGKLTVFNRLNTELPDCPEIPLIGLVKETSHKRPHIVGFHLCKMSRRHIENVDGFLGPGVGGGIREWGQDVLGLGWWSHSSGDGCTMMRMY